MYHQGKFNSSPDSDGTANGTEGDSLDFGDTADDNVKRLLNFLVGIKDGIDDGSLDSDGITKASLRLAGLGWCSQ